MTNERGLDSYRKNKIVAGSPGELMLMLYEESVRVCGVGAGKMEEGDLNEAFGLLLKGQRIVEELLTSLRDEVYPEMVANLRGLLRFAYSRMIEGNLTQDADCVREAEKVLSDLRDIWCVAVDKARSEAFDESEEDAPRGIELSA